MKIRIDVVIMKDVVAPNFLDHRVAISSEHSKKDHVVMDIVVVINTVIIVDVLIDVLLHVPGSVVLLLVINHVQLFVLDVVIVQVP